MKPKGAARTTARVSDLHLQRLAPPLLPGIRRPRDSWIETLAFPKMAQVDNFFQRL